MFPDGETVLPTNATIGEHKMIQHEIRELTNADHAWVRQILVQHWHSTTVVSRGHIHQADVLPGFVALRKGERLGLVTYHVANKECEIVTLNSLVEGKGVGSGLIDAVTNTATLCGCNRLWLVTTNDNTHALRFYQKRGFALVAVHRRAIEQSRLLKPEIPLTGIDGIPIRDEIECEKIL